MRVHWRRLGAEQVLEIRAFFGQRLELAAEFHLLEPAQAAQPHVEDGVDLHLGEFPLPRRRGDVVIFGGGADEGARPVLAHQRGLGVVVVADDVDDAVEVEVGGDEAFQHLEPVVDLLHPVGRAADEHVAPVVEPGAQHLLHRADLGRAPVDQHVHVEGEAHLEVGVAEEHAHQHLGVHRAGAGFEDEAHVLGAFVADVGEDRDLLQLDEFGEALDQLGLLHLVGDFGDDDLPLAAAEVLDPPFRAEAEGAAAGAVGFGDALARFHEDAARGEVGAGDVGEERVVGDVRVLDEVEAGVAEFARCCGAGCSSPCRRRCRRSRWRGGSGRRRAGRRVRGACRRSCRGSRRRPRRALRAAPRPPPSARASV